MEAFNKTKTGVNDKRAAFCSEVENDPPNGGLRGQEQSGDILFGDLVQILEVDSLTKKMLHAPSLSVFILKTVSTNAEKDKKRLYNVLNLWKKLGGALPENLVLFQNIFYYSNLNIVQICSNHTCLFPLKVTSPALRRLPPTQRPAAREARGRLPARHFQAGQENRPDLQAGPD